jgi:flagellar hook-length control protein FliK
VTPSNAPPGIPSPGIPSPSIPSPTNPSPSNPSPTTGGDVSAIGATGAVPGGAVTSSATAPTGDPASADAGTTGQNGSSAVPASDGVAETPLPSPVAAPAPATPSAASAVTTPGDALAPPAGSQVARHVAVLRGAPDGTHTMTLVLTPETLGPVEVQVTVSKGSVDLTLRGAHEHGRAALLDSLPDLRRDLETAGLTCTRLEVDRDTGGSRLSQQGSQQQAFGDRSGQQDRGDRSRPWLRAADITGSGPTRPSQRSTSSGVDVLA